MKLESQNIRSWTSKGISPILERNNPHIGVNIVGASQIHVSFETFTDIYSSSHSITLENSIPSHDTFQRVMGMIEPNIIQRLQVMWNEYVSQNDGEGIMI